MSIKKAYNQIFDLKEAALKKWASNHSQYDSGCTDALEVALEIIKKECSEALKESNVIKCKECGKNFVPRQSSQKFCCKKCREAYWNKQRAERYQAYIKEEFEEASILDALQEW